MPRSRKKITYHGRSGYPVVHKTAKGKKFMMVRAPGGGVKRLYQGSKYRENKTVKKLTL